MKDRILGEALTFDDVLLVPRKSSVVPSSVDVSSKASRRVALNVPILSAAMDTVTESGMAIALAQQGGLGIVHKNLTIEQQVREVYLVKRSVNGVIADPVTLPPDAPIAKARELMEHHRISGIPIVKGNKVIGILTSRDLKFVENGHSVAELMTKGDLVTAPPGTDLKEARDILHRAKVEKLLLVDSKGRLQGLITIKDIDTLARFPMSNLDPLGRLRVGAAVGVADDARVKALAAAKVDLVVVDTAHGHSDNVLKAVARYKAAFPALDIVAGNIVTAEAAHDLISAGADAVKVGVGPGSICTTRIIAGVGVPQLTAISEVAEEAAKKGIPVIADGGIRYSGDIVKALAAGASSVMLGSLLAGVEESPGEVTYNHGRTFKSVRGMGSLGAMAEGSADRYSQADVKSKDKFVPEGVEGLVPFKGRLAEFVYQLVGGLRSGMGYVGCKNIKELNTLPRFVRVTQAGVLESHPHDIQITKEAPNYRVGQTTVKPPSHERILIVDFGAQYTQLIARRVREQQCYAEIVPANVSPARVREAKGLILSGGPASVYAKGAPTIDPEVFRQGTPVLGICYGMQLMAHLLGGKVERADHREFGRAAVEVVEADGLFRGMGGPGGRLDVWISHGDRVENPGTGFQAIATTSSAPFAAVRHGKDPLYGVQFHPEVTHTPRGAEILKNFLYGVCKCRGDWTAASFVEEAVASIREQVGEKDVVLCGLSGGVDSSVAAVLIHEAIGDRLTCIFVDNGLLRMNEADEVRKTFTDHYHIKLRFADSGKRFLDALRGVTDPEEKRRRIGHTFIDVFKHEALSVPGAAWLAQGTLYPDVIESQSAFGGPSAVIKTHHNVGGLPAELGFKLLEPFRTLFKDEVRAIGRLLGVPDSIVKRQPFPGPGLAVRVVGEVTEERLRRLRESDAIVMQEVLKAGFYDRLWQSFAVLIPVQTVGVMGDERTYENVIAIRAVESSDGMTADWADLPHDLLARMSSRIANEVRGINRVVYDVSSKPPATIEWE